MSCGINSSSRILLPDTHRDFTPWVMTRVMMCPDLIKIHHDVALGADAAHHVLQGQGVIDPRRVGHVQVIGFILVPLLHSGHHAVFVRADHVQVLEKQKEGEQGVQTVSQSILEICRDTSGHCLYKSTSFLYWAESFTCGHAAPLCAKSTPGCSGNFVMSRYILKCPGLDWTHLMVHWDVRRPRTCEAAWKRRSRNKAVLHSRENAKEAPELHGFFCRLDANHAAFEVSKWNLKRVNFESRRDY